MSELVEDSFSYTRLDRHLPVRVVTVTHTSSDEAILTRIQNLRNQHCSFALINLATGEIGAVLSMEQTQK